MLRHSPNCCGSQPNLTRRAGGNTWKLCCLVALVPGEGQASQQFAKQSSEPVCPGNLGHGSACVKITNKEFQWLQNCWSHCLGRETDQSPTHCCIQPLACQTRETNWTKRDAVQPIQQLCLLWHLYRRHRSWLSLSTEQNQWPHLIREFSAHSYVIWVLK